MTANQKEFQDYVQYVDSEEAKVKGGVRLSVFNLYNDFMDDPAKTSALFSMEGKRGIKSLFR